MYPRLEKNGKDTSVILPGWTWKLITILTTTACVMVGGWITWTSSTLGSYGRELSTISSGLQRVPDMADEIVDLGNEVATIKADVKNVVKTVDKMSDRIFERHPGP